jgi:hypothetical protein
VAGEEKKMKVNFTIWIPAWMDFIFAWPVMLYRKLKYGYTYRRIYLGEGQWTILDQKDYTRLCGYKWYVYGVRGKFYAGRYKRVSKTNFKILPLHREIMNAPKKRIVDHENRGSLDNRSDNLRFATHAQNTYNRRKKANTSSRFIGVAFEKRTRRWTAYVMRNGKTRWVGRFDREIDAAKARDKAARKYHGRFASLNFPYLAVKNAKKKNKKRNKLMLNRILRKLAIFFI